MKLVFGGGGGRGGLIAPLARGNFDAKPLHVVLEWLGDAHDILGNNGDAEDTRQKGTAGGFPEQDDVALKSEGLEALLAYGHKRFDGAIGHTQYGVVHNKNEIWRWHGLDIDSTQYMWQASEHQAGTKDQHGPRWIFSARILLLLVPGRFLHSVKPGVALEIVLGDSKR